MEKIEIKDLTIVEYSSKSIAIYGNSKPVKEILKKCGAHFNPYLIGGVGWIASKKKRNLIVTRLKEYYNLLEK